MSKTISVLHFLESFMVGGAEKITLDLCRGLSPDLFQSHVVGFNDGELLPLFKAQGNNAKTIEKRPGADLPFLLRLRRFIIDNNVDLVHCINGLTVVNYGVVAATLAGIPSVVAIHGLGHFSEQGLGAAVWRKMLFFATHRIGVSGNICDHVNGFRKHPLPTELIYNGIDNDSGALPPPEKIKLSSQLGVPPDAGIVCVCVANFREVKGHCFLLGAMKLLLAQVPAAHLILIGSGMLEDKLRNQAARLGISSNVHFAGRRDDVARCLQVVDLFVLPSLSEGLPISILEAMRAGLPVVASNVGGIPEVVIDNESGRLVPPENEQRLCDAMLTLTMEPILRGKMGAAGRKIFESKFNQTLFIQKYSNCFERVANQRKR